MPDLRLRLGDEAAAVTRPINRPAGALDGAEYGSVEGRPLDISRRLDGLQGRVQVRQCQPPMLSTVRRLRLYSVGRSPLRPLRLWDVLRVGVSGRLIYGRHPQATDSCPLGSCGPHPSRQVARRQSGKSQARGTDQHGAPPGSHLKSPLAATRTSVLVDL